MSRGDTPSPIVRVCGPDEFAAAFDVSRETLNRLETYAALLRQWQKAVNLVAPSTLDAIWNRHFADSAQLLALAPRAWSWTDLGSGAGFPGLVLAILLADDDKPSAMAVPPTPSPSPHHAEGVSSTRRGGESGPASPQGAVEAGGAHAGPAAHVTLVESDTRKGAFLREAVRNLRLPPGIAVDILSTRAESLTTQVNLPLPEVVCARALAPLERLLALAAPLFAPATVGLFLKGKDAARELQAAEKLWKFNAELVPSRTEANARIVVIRHLEPKAKD